MVSVDNVETNTAFAEQNQANFPILADADRAVSTAYGVLADAGYARRWTYYISPGGVIVRIDREVDARTAGADLVAHLDALGVPRSKNPPASDG